MAVFLDVAVVVEAKRIQVDHPPVDHQCAHRWRQRGIARRLLCRSLEVPDASSDVLAHALQGHKYTSFVSVVGARSACGWTGADCGSQARRAHVIGSTFLWLSTSH